MTREANKREKRNRLLAAARQAFAEKGFRKATVDDIVSKAKVAKGTFYLYFKNKEGVFKELVSMLEKHYGSLKEKIKVEKDFKAKIYLYTKEHFRFVEENKDLARIGLLSFDTADDELKEWFIKLQSYQVDTIKEEIITAGSRIEEPRKTALAFVGIINHFVIHYLINPREKFLPEKEASYVTELFFNGVDNFKLKNN